MMMHKIRFLLFTVSVIIAGLATWYRLQLPPERVDQRYLFIRPIPDVQRAEDFTPFDLPVELNTSHPGITRIDLTLSENPAVQALFDANRSLITLSPKKNRSGKTVITVTATQESITFRTAFTVLVRGVNDPPRALSSYFKTKEEQTLHAKLKARDSDGDSLQFEISRTTLHGNMSLQADGRFAYTPKQDFFGKDTFQYRVTDGTAFSRSKAVTIVVLPVNDPPVARSQKLVTNEETPLDAQFEIRDIDSPRLHVDITASPRHGKLELQKDNRYRYTPAKDFYGTDRFFFRASDGKAQSEKQSVTITVTNINDCPSAHNGTLECKEDTPCRGRLKATDSDNTALKFFIDTPPAHGQVELKKDGVFRYLPKSDYHGKERFTFYAKDMQLQSPSKAIEITVRSADDDAYTAIGRLSGATVKLYDYDSLNTAQPKPVYKTTTSKGKTLNAIGAITLPLDQIASGKLYIITVEEGENYDIDSDGRIDAQSAPNRGIVHLIASGAALKKEHISVNILTELIYERLATRLKAGYDHPSILAALETLAAEYLADDIDRDGQITYADVLAFNDQKDKAALKQPWEYFQKQTQNILDNRLQPHDLQSRCEETPSEKLTYDVAVNGPYAFIANGNEGLSIVRKENIKAPPVATLDTDGYARAVESQGSTVYLADGSAGVKIIDIGDILHPKQLSSIDTLWYALDLELQFPYLYVTDGTSGLVVIEVRDSDHPVQTASLDTPGYAFGLVVRETYAYIADGPTGLQIVDISNPGAPKAVTLHDTPGYAFDVAVDKDYAYVADGSAGIAVIDINNPANPKTLSTIPTDATTFAVEKDGNLLYTAEYGGGVRVFDVSNPKAPFETASYKELCGTFNLKIFKAFIYACDDFSGLVRLKKVRNKIP